MFLIVNPDNKRFCRPLVIEPGNSLESDTEKTYWWPGETWVRPKFVHPEWEKWLVERGELIEVEYAQDTE